MSRVVNVMLSLSLVVFAGCAVDSEVPQPTPISASEVQHIASDPEMIEALNTLASDGATSKLEDGLMFRRGEDYSAVFQVEPAPGEANPYDSLTYRVADGEALVFFELNGDAPTTSRKQPPTSNAGPHCQEWSGWTGLNATWCSGCFPSCLLEGFKATYDREWRIRRCCDDAGSCWGETDYRNARQHCGC